MHKSITLIELLISLLLVGVVVLVVFGIYNASSGFFISSDTKSNVLNEMTYLLDHIDKNVYQATGWEGRPAIEAGGDTITIYQDLKSDGNPLNTPADFNDDRMVKYTFDIDANTVTFQSNGQEDILTNKLINHPTEGNPTIDYDSNDGVLTIDNLCFQQDPNSLYDAKTNPRICITSQKFSTPMQSLN